MEIRVIYINIYYIFFYFEWSVFEGIRGAASIGLVTPDYQLV